MALVSLVMGACCGGTHALLTHLVPGGGIAGEIGRLAFAVAVGVATTAAGALLLRIPEARTLAAGVSRLARRGPVRWGCHLF